jgi:HlyD family secretion protein
MDGLYNRFPWAGTWPVSAAILAENELMRKLILMSLGLAVLVGGYYWVSTNARVNLSVLNGEIVKTKRGDLLIPINASGNIKAASITQVKSKASGEVIAIPFDVGAMVKKGDLVVQLLDVDERNTRDRAAADYNRAVIALESARIQAEEREKVGIPLAQSELISAKARLERAQVAYKVKDEIRQKNQQYMMISEWTEVKTALDASQADLTAAEAKLNQANIAVRMAKQDIATATEAANTAKKTLDDAEQRLRETKIYAPIDGMMLVRNVQMGELVQSGKTMFTGGTVLMEIADVSQIFAVVNVDEADIGQVRDLAPSSARPGSATRPATTQASADSQPVTMPEGVIEKSEPVEVTVESFKDKKFYGMIEQISPQSEVIQAIATFKVKIRITSENRTQLVGLLNTQAEAHFTAKSVRDAILVSYDAFQKDPNGEGYGVYVPWMPPGKAKLEPKFKKCVFGVDNGVDVQVISGLKEGEEVFTKLPQKTEREKQAEEKGG